MEDASVKTEHHPAQKIQRPLNKPKPRLVLEEDNVATCCSETPSTSILIAAAKESLQLKGYAVIEDVITPGQVATAKQYFRDWLTSNPALTEKHNKINPHGIFKFGEIGHQRHAWYLRTLDEVQAPFRTIWDTTELTTGFDGSCWMSGDCNKKDSIWTHTDQAPDTKGLTCVQGFIALTSNKERSLVVYEGSHLLHEAYMSEKKISGKKNWLLIDHEYLARIASTKKVLEVKAGSLVLWDSRTFHQNQYGQMGEERIVQYICLLPKTHKSNTPAQQQKRLKYFEERRTTSHWPYPLQVNGKQPQVYGNPELLIDYSTLIPPHLDDLADKIKLLL
jgi:ectoine hydroxylase-related dioxygenase (phytanoyl-CoA dioxygenase family)